MGNEALVMCVEEDDEEEDDEDALAPCKASRAGGTVSCPGRSGRTLGNTVPSNDVDVGWATLRKGREAAEGPDPCCW